MPGPGELREVCTPCYRCKRLDVPCVIRQTVLGRPGSESSGGASAAGTQRATAGDIPSRMIVDLTSPRTGENREPSVQQHDGRSIDWRTRHIPASGERRRSCNRSTLLVHMPQSPESVLIIRAVDTLRREKVEEEWFRHLASHVGHTPALDLSIKALVAACAYSRGVPRLTSSDCYRALALALSALKAHIKQSQGEPSDDLLASTALLAPFEGVIQENGIPTRLHVTGLAAMLVARPATYPVSDLAREILEFNAGESGVMACIQGALSPFERVDPAYFANRRIGQADGERAQLKALSNELFIRFPRLVRLARLMRCQQSSPQQGLLRDASECLRSLLRLQDGGAEARVLQNVEVRASDDPNAFSYLGQILYFASVKDFEALTQYWQARLSLLRLERHLYKALRSDDTGMCSTLVPASVLGPIVPRQASEMFRLVKSLAMCLECGRTLPLRRQARMFAHAVVVVWGAMTDLSEDLSHNEGLEGLEPLRAQLLRSASITLGAEPALTVEDMDTAAEIFVGGRASRSRIAELFGV